MNNKGKGATNLKHASNVQYVLIVLRETVYKKLFKIW